MAETRDPVEPSEDVVESSTSADERHAQRCLFRHQLFFMLGILVFFVVSFFLYFAVGAKLDALVTCIGVAVCWTLSGVYAIEGKRHMFAGIRGWGYGNVAVRPRMSTAKGAMVVGVLLIVVAVFGWGGLAWMIAVS